MAASNSFGVQTKGVTETRRAQPSVHVRMRVNGEEAEVSFAPYKTLLEVLREELALSGS